MKISFVISDNPFVIGNGVEGHKQSLPEAYMSISLKDLFVVSMQVPQYTTGTSLMCCGYKTGNDKNSNPRIEKREWK